MKQNDPTNMPATEEARSAVDGSIGHTAAILPRCGLLVKGQGV